MVTLQQLRIVIIFSIILFVYFFFQSCTYCKTSKATVYCSAPGCTAKYHFICGIQNNCFFEYSGEFVSYCHSHGERSLYVFEGVNTCCCCFEKIDSYDPVNVIPTCSSCVRRGVAHIKCMKKLAFNAGYDFVCPGCRSNIYREEVKLLGVYVPDRYTTVLFKCPP